MSDKIIINPEVTELITVTRKDSRVVVSSPGTPGPAGQPGTTDYNALTNKPDLTQYATQTYVNTAITNIIDGAPGVLDTLNELAAAINDDSSFASTITTALGNKQDKVSGVSDTEIGYLDGVTSSIQSQINAKLDSTTAATTYQAIVSGVTNTEIGYLDGVTSAIQTQLNDKSTASKTETLTNKTLTTPIINGPMITATGQTPTIHGIYLPAPHTIIFEGTTANDFETTLIAGEPTADRTITLPDATGTIALTNSPTFTGTVDFTGATINGIPTASAATPTTFGTVIGKTDSALDENFAGNAAFGWNALSSVDTGYNNVALGSGALSGITSGFNNIGIGAGAGYVPGAVLETGDNNIIIGVGATSSSDSVSNEITLGNSNATKFRVPGINLEIDEKLAFLGSSLLEPFKTLQFNPGGVYYVEDYGTTSLYDLQTENNWTWNIRGSLTKTIPDLIWNGNFSAIINLTLLAKNGSVPYYMTGFQIDGVSQTVKWQGNIAPSAGNANSIDVYTFNIIPIDLNGPTKIYTVLGSQRKFG